MRVISLDQSHKSDAIALWEACGLTVPWNDPGADFDRALATLSAAVLGAFISDKLIGTVMVGYDGHRGWMYYLGIDPANRGQRLGRALVEAGEAWLRSRGSPKAMLMVRESNEQVTGFYEALGYTDDAVRVLSKRFDK